MLVFDCYVQLRPVASYFSLASSRQSIMAVNAQAGSTSAGVVYATGNWRLGDDGAIHRRGRLRLSTGDTYDGEWVDGQRHGRGVLTLVNGRGRYVGDFRGNKFHGFGLLELAKTQHPLTRRWRAGESYEGEFVDGRFHGRGTFRRQLPSSSEEDRSVVVTAYSGEFETGKFHGTGVATYANGDVYDGQWVHGEWQGHGEVRYASTGGSYAGDFVHGYYHGFGKLLFGTGGGSYTGDFARGQFNGQGTRVYGTSNNGTKRQYEGSWEDDEPDGTGALECADYTLVAQFQRGKAHGRGIQSWTNGDEYEGEFSEGFYHGKGCIKYAGGGEYDGEFVNGKRLGQGKRVFANRDSYVGEWRDDLMHGQGVLTRTAPAVVSGRLSRLPKEKGSTKYTGVSVYSGEFVMGQQTGNACITYKLRVTSSEKSGVDENQNSDEDRALQFEFPVGSRCWHQYSHIGAVKYSGSVHRGYFHGTGSLESPDGKLWRGNWVRGELNGVSERVYLPFALDGIRDVANGHNKTAKGIGMYRIVRYEGELQQGARHGEGTATYENGDRVMGRFVKGFPHGIVRYCFFTPGGAPRNYGCEDKWAVVSTNQDHERFAEYESGKRVRWLNYEEEASIRTREANQNEEDKEQQTEQQVLRALFIG